MAGGLAELEWRGLIALSTDRAALQAALDAGPVTCYCGFDPTAPSLHIGNLVQLLTLRRLQDAGHRPIALVGGSTGLIGDPKPNAERALNTTETVLAWSERVRGQVERYLSFDGSNAARVVNNLDWTGPMSALTFLREVGQHFRVNKMLTKDAVSARLASSSGINYTEFSYQLLQALDFRELYREHGCTLQTGGSDQWGNITAGVDLLHRSEQASVHALATPLVTRADGTKYGKTEGRGTVWLDPELTSPYAFYQFWLGVEDADVARLLGFFTFRDRVEIDRLAAEAAERPGAREAQRALAEDVTTLVHGSAATRAVQDASAALFGGGDLTLLEPSVLSAALATVPGVDVAGAAGAAGQAPSVAQVLVSTGLAPSLSGARRTIAEGGASVNNVRVADPAALVDLDSAIHGRWLVLRRGRRSVAGVRLVDRPDGHRPAPAQALGRAPAQGLDRAPGRALDRD